ncbi:acyl-CoA dehydrogenase family protein [Aquirufa sp. ROCK-SH2]
MSSMNTGIKGGEFLVRELATSELFIPEDFTEEQKMIEQTCADFIKAEITPILDEIDSAKDNSLMSGLMDKAGALGLLGTSVPEEYGGFGMDFNTSMLVAEACGSGHSFAVALSGHTGIGTLPILYYGSEDQKQRYLPKLASGEYKAAYCLTEPDSGSDANAAKSKAKLNEAGTHYIINGQKMWITNGGFADLFIVFAKIDEDKTLTAFIVEKGYPGITMNEEEHKMGIKGSSTRQIFFNDCLVPVENLLFKREGGFKIAVNILNIGRIKLAAAVMGGSKRVIDLAAKYSDDRKQFGVSLHTFGAIQHKLAEMVIKTFATESACYRAGQDIDNSILALKAAGLSDAEAKLKGVEQFAIECAILKVHASEVLDFVVDEGVQIYGGMGFSADAPMERSYRDSRINRIFEGTNEINRLLAVGTVLKRAMKGELDIMTPALNVGKEILAVPDFNKSLGEGPFSKEREVLKNLKKAILLTAGAALQKFTVQIEKEQEILMAVADMMIEVYVAESALVRAEKLIEKNGEEKTIVQKECALVYLHHAVEIVAKQGREVISGFATGDELNVLLMGLKRFTKIDPKNLIQARRVIAAALIEKKSYNL